MELDRRQIIMSAVGLAAVLVFGACLFVYGPLLKELKIKESQYRAAYSELETARRRIADLKQSNKKRVLANERNVSLAIDELTREGKSKGVQFISMTPKEIPPQGNASYKIIPIEIEIESSYQTLGMFLALLSEFEHSLVTVARFHVMPDKNPSQLKTSLTLHMVLANAE